MLPTDAPEAEPQILYLFPGLQNIDWIPKVDPEPTTPFDIIQPVLQYPFLSGEDDNGRNWGVRSWCALVFSSKHMHADAHAEPLQ